MVISETVVSTDHKIIRHKRKVIQEYPRIFFSFFFFFFLLSKCQLRSSFQNVSYGVVVLVCCMNLSVCVCVCVCACVCTCVRAYVYKGYYNINDTGEGRSGREIRAKSDAKIV